MDDKQKIQSLETRLKKLENIFYGISDDPRVKEVIRKNIIIGEHAAGKPTIISKEGIKYNLAIDGGTGSFVDLGSGTNLTIASGSITPTQGFHDVDTEGGAASDNLDTIVDTGISTGAMLLLRAVSSSRTVVLKDGTGNLILSGDFSLDNRDDVILLVRTTGGWVEVSRSDNAA